MATYAVSDLHGQDRTFEKGLKLIGFSDSDMLYVIGDAIDRGPDGIRILEYIKPRVFDAEFGPYGRWPGL